MLEGPDEAGRRRALHTVRATLAAHQTSSGVTDDSVTWLVIARTG
jgi:hypothetical protein